MKEYFVDRQSVVRQIWGKSDTILLIFAGASAEFALNKAVDWLYFTGRLPGDPLGRLFSTVAYARTIVFAEMQPALRAIDAMAAIHRQVEARRAATIPDWAYRDVLFMLIDYSIRSYEALERNLSQVEKAEVFDVFCRVGTRMGLADLPSTLDEWIEMRQKQLEQNLKRTHYTDDLFQQYQKHLGMLRYRTLLEAQALVAPQQVREHLGLTRNSLLSPLIPPYRVSKIFGMDRFVKALILPQKFKEQFQTLDYGID